MGNLTTTAIKSIKPGATVMRHPDGDGLYLTVKQSGAKSWLLRVQTNGRRRDIGLGTFPAVSLLMARENAMQLRKQLLAGEDPVETRRAAKRAAAGIPTFRAAAETVHSERRDDWRNQKHRDQWINTLRTFAFPLIGEKRLDKVTAGDVRAVMLPIWQSKPETARRLLQRIVKVLDWGFSEGHCKGEAPLRSIRAGLNAQLARPEHFASLPYAEVPALMQALAEGETAGRLALQFLIVTAARSGEVRGATWDEFDLPAAMWKIPASRMKAKKEHRVPLSTAALAVLKKAALLRKGIAGEPVFPGMKHQPLSDATMGKVLSAAINGQWTVHGFRSSFRVWAAESGYQHEAAEAALAHTISNKVVAAYLRTDFLDQRRPMMDAWAAFLLPPG